MPCKWQRGLGGPCESGSVQGAPATAGWVREGPGRCHGMKPRNADRTTLELFPLRKGRARAHRGVCAAGGEAIRGERGLGSGRARQWHQVSDCSTVGVSSDKGHQSLGTNGPAFREIGRGSVSGERTRLGCGTLQANAYGGNQGVAIDNALDPDDGLTRHGLVCKAGEAPRSCRLGRLRQRC